MPSRLISVCTARTGPTLRTTRTFSFFSAAFAAVNSVFIFTLRRMPPTCTSASPCLRLTESTSPSDCMAGTKTRSPARRADASTGADAGFGCSSLSLSYALSASLFFRVRARIRSASVSCFCEAIFSISARSSSACAVRSPTMRRLSTFAVANSFSRSFRSFSRSALTSASFSVHCFSSAEARFFASSASMRDSSAERRMFSNFLPPSERLDRASCKISSGSPSLREMAMALLLPGTPARRRYSGRSVVPSNSMLAFSIPSSA